MKFWATLKKTLPEKVRKDKALQKLAGDVLKFETLEDLTKALEKSKIK